MSLTKGLNVLPCIEGRRRNRVEWLVARPRVTDPRAFTHGCVFNRGVNEVIH